MLCAFVFLDVAVFTHIARILLSDDEPAPLEIRNPYIGLDELYEYHIVNSSIHQPIMDKPRRIAHVFRDDPQRPSPIDEHRGMTPFGMMTPPNQHLSVSSNVSSTTTSGSDGESGADSGEQKHTILQFRAIDFGMESCELRLQLPALDDKTQDPFVFEGEVLLDVCELEADELLDVPKVSWATRPRCRQQVGTFAATPGSDVSLPQFPCKWGTLHTFEISCSPRTPNCQLDVWATQNALWGK